MMKPAGFKSIYCGKQYGFFTNLLEVLRLDFVPLGLKLFFLDIFYKLSNF